MAESNIIQMHDYAGNNQYPVTLASLVYDEDGETVAKKLALLLDWFEWGDEKKTSVKTKYPFWSEKQLSAGGIGEESGSGEGGIGTITGIKVNGEVWNEPDEFGVLTIPDYPTSLEWANIAGRPENLSEFNNDKGYITEVTERMIVDATDAIPNSGKVLISTGGTFGWVLYPRNLSDLTDDVVAGKYLSLAGGTIDSSNSIPLVVNTSSNVEVAVKLTQNAQLRAVIGYDIYNGAYIQNGINNRFLAIADNGTPYYYNGSYKDTLIHTGNVGEYAFVPRADDLINNVYADNYVTNGAYLNQTGNGSGNNNFPAEYSMFLVFSNGSPYRVAQLSLGGSKIHYRIKIDSWINWREIACTDSNVASADYASNAGTLNGVSLSSGSNTPWGTIPMITEAGWMDVGKHFEFHYDNTTNIDYSTILMCTGNHKNVVNLPSASGTLALLTDTVEAANRLATPRTIWGQPFDGTGNVSNHLTGVSYIEFRDTTSSSGIYQGNILDPNLRENDIGIYTPKLYISGYVGLGTMTPRVKLDINGDIYAAEYSSLRNDKRWIFGAGAITGDDNHFVFTDATTYSAHLIIDSTTSSVGIGIKPEYRLDVTASARLASIVFQNNDEINRYSGDLWIQYRHTTGAGNVRMCSQGGGVTIGGVDVEDYAFHVAGNARFQDSLTIGSAVLSWDSVNNALKIEGNVYTTGQLSAGGVGTEVQKVFDIAAESSAATANRPYTKTLTHNLNTYDLAVVVYEVTENATTEKLTQVLADVTLTDENKVEVYFASRKVDKKYRIVIIG